MEKLDLKKLFGAEVKRRRNELGISQEELAERANLHRTYVSDVEAGKRNPSLASIERLANGLGASLSSVFGSAEVKHAAPGEARPAGQVPDILIIENDARELELMLKTFKAVRLTNHIQVMRDGAAALDYFFGKQGQDRPRNTKLPQVVLLDLQLSKIDALQLLRRLKTDQYTRAIPVLVLATSRKNDRVQEALRLGADDCIVKPLDFQSFSQITPKLSFVWALLKSEARRWESRL